MYKPTAHCRYVPEGQAVQKTVASGKSSHRKFMSEESLEVPQLDNADAAHLVASTLIGLIPFAGGADLFKFILSPSLEKRKERWMQLVVEAIRALQVRAEFSIEGLRDNEEFTTLLIQTTQSAMNTHLKSKHQLLKTALINAALTNFEFDTKQLYLNLLDRFTPTHIVVLHSVRGTKQHTTALRSGNLYHDKLIEIQDLIAMNISGVLFLAILEDLHSAGLLVISNDFIITDGDVEQTSVIAYEDSGTTGLPNINITDLGNHFISFVTE